MRVRHYDPVMHRIPIAAAALALLLAAPAAAQDVPPGLSKDQPISVAGETIPLSELQHWAGLARLSSGDPRTPRTRAHLEQAAQLLISYRWIEGEAAALGITVSRERVLRSFRRQRRQSFPRRRDYVEFLRDSRQTQRDVVRRVRLDLLSNRIRDHAIGDTKDPEEQQVRLEAFVQDFRARWIAATLCTPRFATMELIGCGNAVRPVPGTAPGSGRW